MLNSSHYVKTQGQMQEFNNFYQIITRLLVYLNHPSKLIHFPHTFGKPHNGRMSKLEVVLTNPLGSASLPLGLHSA